jgi:hypothetical protein
MSTRHILSERDEQEFWAIFGYGKDEMLESDTQHECTRNG